jgi:hypothetical protein
MRGVRQFSPKETEPRNVMYQVQSFRSFPFFREQSALPYCIKLMRENDPVYEGNRIQKPYKDTTNPKISQHTRYGHNDKNTLSPTRAPGAHHDQTSATKNDTIPRLS